MDTGGTSCPFSLSTGSSAPSTSISRTPINLGFELGENASMMGFKGDERNRGSFELVGAGIPEWNGAVVVVVEGEPGGRVFISAD